METASNFIGSKIRDVRTTQKMTQVQLAKAAGIAVNSLRLYEAGKLSPKYETLQKIANVLGVDVIAFLPSPYVNKQYFDNVKGNLSKLQIELLETDARTERYYDYWDKVRTRQERLKAAYNMLNDNGQEIAVQRMEELTKISDYLRSDDDISPEEPYLNVANLPEEDQKLLEQALNDEHGANEK